MTTLLERPASRAGEPRPPASPGRPTRFRRVRDGLAHRSTSLVYLLPLLALTTLVSRIGFAGSPQRIDDEGTYTAQAYAVDKLGELTHYTYWYDHPPLGWIQIGAYTWLTDAFDRYDVAVVAGREAMVVAHVIAAALLWVLARRLDLTRPAAAAAVLLYALSPLAVQFSRTVYLDNVAMPWALAAFVLALTKRNQLVAFAGSAACFGVAVLSKETFLLLLPFLAWQMWRSAHPSTRRYTLSVAVALLTLMLGSYLAFAVLKGEVFPGRDRVSLYDGVMFQLVNRDSSGSVLDAASQAGRSIRVWLTLDPVLPVAGLLAALGGLFVRRLRPIAAMFVALGAVLLKPGYLPVPYVIVMIPFAALLVAAMVDHLVRRHRRWLTGSVGVASVVTAAIAAPLWGPQLRGLWLADLDRPLVQAQTWIDDNVARQDRLLVDDAAWVDLVRAGFPRDDVVWFYKADTDSDVSDRAPNGWRDYDYVLVTQALRRSVGSFPTVQEALTNGTRTAVFGDGDNEVEVYAVHAEGERAYDEARARDDDARAAAGQALATNARITFSRTARAALDQGRVDSRVVSLLALLAGEHRFAVSDFPVVFGEQDQVPVRTVTISEVDGAPVSSTPPTAVTSLIEDQLGSYLPEQVSLEGGGLSVRYDVTSPTDVLPAQ